MGTCPVHRPPFFKSDVFLVLPHSHCHSQRVSPNHPLSSPARLPLSPGASVILQARGPSWFWALSPLLWPRCPLLAPLEINSGLLRRRLLKKIFRLLLLPSFSSLLCLDPHKRLECGKGNGNIQGEERTLNISHGVHT